MSRLHAILAFREADPATGGLGIEIANLANGLAARGHRITVATMRGSGRGPQGAVGGYDDAVEVVELDPWVGGRRGVAFGLAGGMAALVRARPRALVHVYSCLPVYAHAAAMAAARAARRPLVWTPMLHPSRAASWRGQGLAGRAMAAFDALAPHVARAVDLVAAATDDEAAAFRRLGARRVEMLPPAVPAAGVVPAGEAAALRSRLGIGDGPMVLCVAGRADRRKGLGMAARAIAELRRDRPGATLAVLGLPGAAGEIGDGVRALGRLSRADLARAYRAADAVLVPSTYEAFSRVVAEAWQQETAVAVTDGVALAPVVRSVGGHVVASGDAQAAARALEALLADPAAAAAQGRAGRRIVQERYLVGHVVERAEQLYGELAHG